MSPAYWTPAERRYQRTRKSKRERMDALAAEMRARNARVVRIRETLRRRKAEAAKSMEEK